MNNLFFRLVTLFVFYSDFVRLTTAIESVFKMAAKSGGNDEWFSAIKPILVASSGSLNKNSVIELIKNIVKK